MSLWLTPEAGRCMPRATPRRFWNWHQSPEMSGREILDKKSPAEAGLSIT
jgi:hypothetical protein